MKTNKKKTDKSVIAALIFFLALVIVAVNIRSDEGTWFESAMISAFAPIQKVVTASFRGARDVIDSYIYLAGVKEKIIDIEERNRELIFENNRLNEIILKYKRVETLHSIKDSFFQYKLLLSNVIGYDPSNWSRMIVIDKGTSDSVQKNMAVITHKSLVGRVVQAMDHHSKILLVTDARSSVDAVIQSTRDRGIVSGTNDNYFTVEYLSVNSEVREGDKIVSSGMGGTVQSGLMIGTVRKVFEQSKGLFKRVEVTPSSDMDRLEEVFVVVSSSTNGE
ncbi:MAG: rod shape-determining protein MreC [Nitrospinota bacterium]